LTKGAIRAQERLLGHFFGTTPVAAESIGQIDQWPMPSMDNRLECIDVASENFFNVNLIVAGAQYPLLRVRPPVDRPGCVFCEPASKASGNEKMQPEGPTSGLTK
jgi:hypothetical protein